MNFYSLNIIQKSIASLFVALIVIALFIHNPFGGYEIRKENPLYSSGFHDVPCTQQEKDSYRADFEALRKMGIGITEKQEDTQAYIDSSVAACIKGAPYVPYEIVAPFSEWRSSNPIVPWLGNIANLLQLMVAVSIVLGVMFYIFKDQKYEEWFLVLCEPGNPVTR